MDKLSHLLSGQMDGLMWRLNGVAANVANANTPGFKRNVTNFRAVLREATGESHLRPMGSLDLSPGEIQQTGRPLDLALRGDGYFVLETPSGPRYTRRGRMLLNAQGELIDNAGNRFASENGSLQIPPNANQVTVTTSGEVKADGQSLGKIMTVTIPEPDKLRRAGHGLLRNTGAQARPSEETTVVQGAVENSNVRPVQEMVEMIEIMRAYQGAVRIKKRMGALRRELTQKIT
jgi:flagellar basal-body rod protein FlgF